MKTRNILCILLCCWGIVAVLQAQPTMQESPQLLGAQVISTKYFEFANTLSPTGDTIYFCRSFAAFGDNCAVLMSTRKNGRWQAPVMAPFSGQFRDVDPALSPDGRRLWFSSTRPHPAKQGRTDYDIWYVDIANGRFGEPIRLDSTINSSGDEVYPWVDKQGNLIFAQQNQRDILYAEWNGQKFLTPRTLEFNQPNYNEVDAAISAEGDFIIYTANYPGGTGGLDLYISFKNEEGKWSKGIHLGNKINSNMMEITPAISPDGKLLLFASSRTSMPMPRRKVIDVHQLHKELEQVENGLLNIFQINISDIKKLNQKAL